MRKLSTRMAEDMYKKCEGALLSLEQIVRYTGRSRSWVAEQLATLEPVKYGTKRKYYFYQDVARYLCECTDFIKR